jgi:hypothetical protein
MISILIESECEAIHRQCASGPRSTSNIFHDEIVSPDVVPAGVFVRVLSDILEAANESCTNVSVVQNCVATIHKNRSVVLSTILLPCADPSSNAFCDPRPSLTEAWLVALTHFIDASKRSAAVASDIFVETVCDTAAAVFALLLYPSVGRTQDDRSADPGQSLDGPQSLALTDFLPEFFSLGPEVLQRVTGTLSKHMAVAFGTEGQELDEWTRGRAIVGAAIFRASQGALPPWTVESIPELYSTLYLSLDRSPEAFGRTLRASMSLRLDPSAPQFGGVMPGNLLAGPYFDTLSTSSVDRFVEEAMALSRSNDTSSWRRFKVAVKQICGGKKKDTDFQLKPSYTRWDFDRL